MRLVRWQILALVALFLAAAPARAEEDAPEWTTQAFLEEHLANACDEIERLTGAKYPERPRLAIADIEGMTKILVKDIGPVFRNLGVTSGAVIRATAAQLSAALTAKYEPATNTIHMMPANIVRLADMLEIPEAASAGPVRILLAHEGTHALDFQRFPALDRERLSRTTAEGIQAVGAVLEGHAQLVAERVAMAWEMHKDWQTLTALILADMPTDDPALRTLMQASTADTQFAYRAGLTFLRAVEAATGREGIEAALADPPKNTRQIERPDEWLDPSIAPETFDPEPAFDVLRHLIEGESASGRLKRALLDVGFSILPAETRDPILAEFVDGWQLSGASGSPGGATTALVVVFDTPDTARRYVAMTETLLHARDEQIEQSPSLTMEALEYGKLGPDGTYGMYARKQISFDGGTQDVLVCCGHGGRFAIELNVIQPDDPARIERVMLGALAVLRGEDPRPWLVDPADLLRARAEAFRSAQEADDEATLRELAAALAPTSDELKQVLREGDATSAFLEAYGGPRDVTKDSDAALAMGRALFDPGDGKNTEICVWAATTEEIVAYEKGTDAYREFPGGMRRFAERVAEPRRTWFVVELTPPGGSWGSKYSCFTMVGDRLVFLEKPWQAVPR